MRTTANQLPTPESNWFYSQKEKLRRVAKGMLGFNSSVGEGTSSGPLSAIVRAESTIMSHELIASPTERAPTCQDDWPILA